MTRDVAVVICLHDDRRWSDVQAALRSVNQQTHQPAEIVLVVDHNQALLVRARQQFSTVTVIENSETRGLGGSRNSGISATSAPVIAFLDDDAIASPQWLELLIDQYSDPSVAGVGGSIEPAWDDGRPQWFPKEFDWVVGCSYRGMPDVTRDVRNLFGCNMSFRRQTLTALGRFRLGYGCDETELCIRTHQRWPWARLVYVPQAKVIHRVRANRAQVQYFLTRCYFEGGSKAVVARLVGAAAGLSDEWHYTLRTLPAGARLGVKHFAREGDVAGLARATMIVAGLATTTLGYVSGSLLTSRAARRRGWAQPTLPSTSRRPSHDRVK